jgi:molybdate transport system substrate-binding protein
MSETIRLFAAVAVRPALLGLASRFEATTGSGVELEFDLNPAVKKRIEAGEPFDVVVINPHMVEDLVAAAKVRPGSLLRFGRIPMGVAARAGSPLRDIGTAAAFAEVLGNARSIAYAAEGSSGAYFTGLLQRLSIVDEITPKLVPIAGAHTATSVVRGEAELAVVPVTSILAAAPEVMLLGRFPAELQSYIEFAIGIGAEARNPAAAARLAALLVSAEADDVLAAAGLERS